MSTTIVAQVQGAENAIRYQSSDTDLIWEALQAAGSGVLSIGGRPLMDGNKRLALLGDASLKLALVEDWYGGVEARGRADQIMQSVSSNTNLDRVARLHGLDAFVSRSPSQGRMISPNLMAATMEAIVGAVYLDSDLDIVKRVIRNLGLIPT